MQEWIIYAFIGFIGYFFVNILFKYVSNENPLLISMVLYASAAIAMFILLLPKGDFSITQKDLLIAIFIGLFSVTATIFALKSINLSPNPGYSSAIYSANFVLIAIVSVFLFNSELTLQKFIGILLTFVGLILLSI